MSRRRWLAAVLLSTLILSGIVIYYVIEQPAPPPHIGIFYYAWYGALSTDWKPSKFIDHPVGILGNYSSANITVIKQQLLWIRDLGVNFVVISWWGCKENDSYGQFIDSNTRKVFQVAEDNMINLKFCIMVEPFLRNDSSYDYSEIYNHVYDNFVEPYPSIYYNDSQPLICFFNDPNHHPGLTPNGTITYNDARFSTVIVGQQSYVQWVYTDLDIWDKPKRIPYTNEISVTPRFDDSRLNRSKSCTVDPDLSQGIYDQEWKNAIQLWKDRKINTIMITSWNEYPERTEIEPHIDANATAYVNATYYLYNKTQYYISQVK